MDRTIVDKKKLRVFYTDPLDYHSIVEALEGCCGLFYSFEPPSDQPSYDVCSVISFDFSWIFNG